MISGRPPRVGAIVHLAANGPSGAKECHAAIVTAILADDGTVELTEFDGAGITCHVGIEHHGDYSTIRPCGETPPTDPTGTWHWPVSR